MTVLWDWNGTLIADVPLTVRLENEVFASFGVNKMVTEEEYRNKFHFPVRSYYEDFGITGNQFNIVAAEWNRQYFMNLEGIPLAAGAVETIGQINSAGMQQVIISATQREQLLQQVALYPEIYSYFDEILGIEDVYGESKVHIAASYMQRTGKQPGKVIFIGDTEHDAKVAEKIGCQCILITENGHQSEKVLQKTNAKILKNLSELRKYLGV